MSPVELAEYLDVVREHGGTEFRLDSPDGSHVSVKLEPSRQPEAPFIDSKGAPVNLDEGAPWNARDPLEEANFPGKPE